MHDENGGNFIKGTNSIARVGAIYLATDFNHPCTPS
jgi:hypothetical protein